MAETYVRHVQLLGFEKRFFPSQHYVYMLLVKWSDLTEKLIYRTYPEIYTFHKSLKEMFPIEAGKIEKRDRIIPSLSAPPWLDSQKSTETRQTTLSDYCHSLVNLPPHISRCTHLTGFFTVRPEDENPPSPNILKRNETFVVSKDLARGNVSEISGPIILDMYRAIADYTKTTKYEINLHAGDQVEIVEKNQNGWWFCQCDSKRGWVPASYLEPLDGPEESEEAEPDYGGELYITIKAYKAEQEDEITLDLGESIEVIHKLLDGWWVVRKGEQMGYFPSMFLQKANKREQSESSRANVQGHKPPPRRSTIRNAKSIHNKSRQRLSQDTYRRNSRRYLQQKGGQLVKPDPYPRNVAKSPLRERRNQGNIPEESSTISENEGKREAPVIPPRPSPELILQRCSDNTRKKISIHKSSSASTSKASSFPHIEGETVYFQNKTKPRLRLSLLCSVKVSTV
uniref:Neutrophil cytosolic factor 1 n=1 Tax=Takifugu rubripes TaxID=31033 RepID=A0A674MFJ3_TAKRU